MVMMCLCNAKLKPSTALIFLLENDSLFFLRLSTFVCDAAVACQPLLCDLACEYGFLYDENECPLCACFDPCDVR